LSRSARNKNDWFDEDDESFKQVMIWTHDKTGKATLSCQTKNAGIRPLKSAPLHSFSSKRMPI
jgi:hypothetical protein